jgi:acetoacetyl-CoA synthetase
MIGDILWTPRDDMRANTQMGRFMQWLVDHRGLEFADYEALRRWSISDLEGFWTAIWEFFEVRAHHPYERALGSREMPGAQWFPGARLNYAEHLLGRQADEDRVAVIAESQSRDLEQLTFGELGDLVARVRCGLQSLGVGPGDRVVGYLPNIPETVAAFIATASLGAVWATCAPEFGARSVVARYAQLAPKVLITVGGYGFRDRWIDRRAEVESIREGLPSLQHVVWVPFGEAQVDAAIPWSQLTAHSEPLAFEPVAFDHPLYILFSSGTTGVPKAIIHGHGGQLIEHLKSQGLVWDLGPGSRLQQFTTTAWMMWNVLVSGLLVGSSIVLLDGDPTWPDVRELWRVAERHSATVLGLAPPYLMACRREGIELRDEFDLGSLRALITAGSPLPAQGYRWVYDQLGPDIVLINGSGGTDVCTGLVSGSFATPVYEGEISGPCIGVDAQAFDQAGRSVVGERGELVITQPMPSMPVGLWGDRDGRRYRESYFDRYPGVWRQGDWISFTERGSCVLSGRSDATLNRGGVRLGSGEFYAVVDDIPELADALVVHLEDTDGGMGELLLFVVTSPSSTLDEDLRRRISGMLRNELSPRHVPDEIIAVAAIPRTLTGKKLETPVKRILRGEPPEAVCSRDALADPLAVDAFVAVARPRAGTMA